MFRTSFSPFTVSNELKEIFARENILMKSISRKGGKQHLWWRDRVIYHMEQFNHITRILDSWLLRRAIWRSSLGQMKLAELASDEKDRLFAALSKVEIRSQRRAETLKELMGSYIITLSTRLFIRLRNTDQLTVMATMLDDDSSELFPGYRSDSSEEMRPATPDVKEPATPKLFQPATPKPLSVKERAREYEKLRAIENQSARTRLQ